ncbi:MAG: GIY-YIG nuclease family protein [Waterburya sp.]
MLADSEILHLPKVSLETKELLPEYSGIYYVVDENKIVWYVGKAKNLRKRWQGKSHHRIYQLKQLKHKYFDIHYESVDLSQLDQREKQQIAKYTPHLNNSPVKNKKVHPTETLLRETIATISDFTFIIGVEPPRREIKDQINISWLIKEQLLDMPIIHICLDSIIFKALFNPQSSDEQAAIIRNAFNTRKTYTNKWESFLKGYLFLLRLSVNGYIIEFGDLNTCIGNKNLENRLEYNHTEIAKEQIRTLTPESLIQIQHNNSAQQSKKIQLERLKPYTSDLIPLFFNELIDTQCAKQKLEKISRDYRLGKRGVGSRSNKTDSAFAVNELLINQGKNPQKYIQDKKTGYYQNGYIRSIDQHKIGLCTKSFVVDLRKPRLLKLNSTVPTRCSVLALGIINDQLIEDTSSIFNIVYLLTIVEKTAWLLVEEYLQDFAIPSNQLKNGEGFIKKCYVTERKYIVPAKVNIKLETINYSAWIPFGMNEQYPTFEAAKEEIKTRLYEANLPGLKLTFKKESIAK